MSSNTRCTRFSARLTKRLQRLLGNCQCHLCFSKRVWNEDGGYVTLWCEVITGFSKAEDYVSFTGHSLVGHYIFLPPSSSVTPQHLVMSPQVSWVQMSIKRCDAGGKQQSQSCWLMIRCSQMASRCLFLVLRVTATIQVCLPWQIVTLCVYVWCNDWIYSAGCTSC